jgi:signal peptidase I
MNNKKIIILLSILVFIIFVKFDLNNQTPKTNTTSEQREIINYNESCISAKTTKTVRNHSMSPMINEGDELELLEGYYDCNEVERGDVAAYNHSGNEYPLIKKILVLGGDKLEIIGDNLMVNDEVLKNSAGEAYFLNEQNKKMIGLYIEEGRLRSDAYLIFGDNSNSSLDSRRFGAVGKSGFLGKFVLD